MVNHSLFYTLLLSLLPGVGASRYWAWMDIHGSPEKVLLSKPEALPEISVRARKILIDFQCQGETSTLASKGYQVLECLEKHGAQLLSHQDSKYPQLLKQIHRPPPLLYTKGNVDLLSMPQLAVIGTRNPTQSGIENTRAFSRYLSQNGFVITSGLALGIDAMAHEAAVATSGHTVAVMATGIDSIYPQRHDRLARSIVDKGGLLITEFSPGTSAHAAHFPQRNRLISGLSIGTIVMEAAIKSGSLITAKYAMEQNREVFAVPGSIHNPQAKGCHALLKQGAHLAETGMDIVEQLSGLIQHYVAQSVAAEEKPEPFPELSSTEKAVLKKMGYDTIAIEQIIERTGLTSTEVTSTLLNLELKGVVKHSSWGYEAIREVV